MATAIYQDGLVTGSNTYAGCEQAMLAAGAPTNNYGAHLLTRVDNVLHSLVKFDLSLLPNGNAWPSGSTVSAVNLTMQVHQVDGGGCLVAGYRVLVDWTEGTDTGAVPTDGGCTWNDRISVGTTWGDPGGDLAGTDHWTESSLASTIITTGSETFSTGTIVVADVQGFLDGTYTNYGWILLRTGPLTGGVRMRSDDYTTDITERPLLTITYAVPKAGGGAMSLGARGRMRLSMGGGGRR